VSKRISQAFTGWWWSLPFHYWSLGWRGMWESIWRRRRRCVICGDFFWREGAFNPLMGVNIFEEHCSAGCAEEDNQMCEQMFPHIIKEKQSLVKRYEEFSTAQPARDPQHGLPDLAAGHATGAAGRLNQPDPGDQSAANGFAVGTASSAAPSRTDAPVSDPAHPSAGGA
jgi:hypothetical protein